MHFMKPEKTSYSWGISILFLYTSFCYYVNTIQPIQQEECNLTRPNLASPGRPAPMKKLKNISTIEVLGIVIIHIEVKLLSNRQVTDTQPMVAAAAAAAAVVAVAKRILICRMPSSV